MVVLQLIIIYSLKLVKKIIRLFKLGSGTSLPGIIIETKFPSLITFMAKRYKTIILITGTNGKTTTLHTLTTILKNSNFSISCNLSGANILRGVATTLIDDFSLKSKRQFAVFEVEEATMPRLTSLLNANYIVITNVFRDQLDVYGEVNKTLEYMELACNNSPSAQIILNIDDPLLNKLSKRIKNEMQPYSLGRYRTKFDYEGVSETNFLESLSIQIQNIMLHSDGSTNTTLNIQGQIYTINLQLPGIYNVYNASAAITTSLLLGIPIKKILKSLESVKAVFGRGELVKITPEDRPLITLRIFLIKNPAGFSQVLQTVKSVEHEHILLALNDNTADGKDVSWIWDASIDDLKAKQITTTGKRALDMALRIKYDTKTTYSSLIVQPDLRSCIIDIISNKKLSSSTILANYTAMNNIRTILGEYTHLEPLT